MVARALGKGNWDLLFNGEEVSVWDVNKGLKIDGADGCTALWMYSMPLNFHMVICKILCCLYFAAIFKKKQNKKLLWQYFQRKKQNKCILRDLGEISAGKNNYEEKSMWQIGLMPAHISLAPPLCVETCLPRTLVSPCLQVLSTDGSTLSLCIGKL